LLFFFLPSSLSLSPIHSQCDKKETAIGSKKEAHMRETREVHTAHKSKREIKSGGKIEKKNPINHQEKKN